jgi:hypothetical protein
MKIVIIFLVLFALACDDECKADEEECRGSKIFVCEDGSWIELLDCSEVVEPDGVDLWTCCEVEENGEFIPDCVQGGCEG